MRSATHWVVNAERDGTYQRELLVEKGAVHGGRGQLDVPMVSLLVETDVEMVVRCGGEVVT